MDVMYVIEKIYGNYQALYMTEADIERTFSIPRLIPYLFQSQF
jgi:hypothetical protein